MPRLIVILILLWGATTWSQAPAFDVVSVKPAAAGPPPGFMQVGLQAGGRLIAINAPLRLLIRTAYELDDYQLLGAEDWMNRDRFEIQATAGRDITQPEARLMLQALLEDRFRLAAHEETRDLPMYELTLARADSPLGERMRTSAPECAPVALPAGVPPPPPPPAGAASVTPLGAGQRLRCPSIFAPGWVSARQVSVDVLAGYLTTFSGRPVANRTGLSGVFDVDLMYSPDTGFIAAPPPGAPVPAAADAPQLATAIVEQLGLRLVPIRGPVRVLVIDSAERPTEN